MRHGVERAVLAAYVACFGVGAINHARDFIVAGWRPYRWGPPLLEAFWTSLIALDALTIMLLVSGRRRIGVMLAVAIMALDVAANAYAWLALDVAAFAIAVPLQAAFLGFVIGSAPFLWSSKSAPA